MKTKKKSLISQSNKKEILWNVVNSLLFGAAFFCGSLLDGEITWKGIMVAGIAALSMIIIKFQSYWKKEESEYCKCIGNFL